MKTKIFNLLGGQKPGHPPLPTREKPSFKILVVDDEPLVCESIKSFLDKEGHFVRTADGHGQCFQLLEKSEFDIILLDLQMPGMDGLSILKKVRETRPFTAIIMMSAKGTIDHAVEAMKFGAADYLQKPFSFGKLREMIAKTAKEHLFERRDDASLPPLKRIGSYVLTEEIGKGSSSTIYKAAHLRLQKTVAVKILHENLTHSVSFTRRFYREARTTASLSHPNIIDVVDYGHEGPNFFLVMEYIQGHALSHHLSKTERLPIRLAVLICIEVCKALEYAHQKGIVHRDIKLQNIFISDEGRVKLLDFGIARCLKSEETVLTIPGCIIGTPAFMSPEQALGQKLTPASDLFSLGTVLYGLLTLRLPFSEKSVAATLHKVSRSDYPEPASVNPEIDKELNDIIVRCMQLNPEKRFSSAHELLLALKKWHAGKQPKTALNILTQYFRNQRNNLDKLMNNVDRLFS